MTRIYTSSAVLLTWVLALTFCDSEVKYLGPRYVEEDSTFVIECHLLAAGPLKWIKDNKKLEGPEYTMNMKVQNSTFQLSELVVRNANTNHTGHYKCYAFSPESHPISVVFGLTAGAGTVQTVDLNLSKENPDNILHCNLTLDPTLNITWMKESALLDTSNTQKYAIVRNDSSIGIDLVIKNADDSDAGIYTCFIGDVKTHNQTIIARTKPRFEKLFPKSINLVEGEKLNLTCIAFGYPTPNVTWYKDDVPVKELNSTRIKLMPSSSNVSDAFLVIEQLVDEDRALYRCDIANEVSEANSTCMIRVKDKLAALWPFLGIVAEVAILCTIIFIYEKRRAKQEYDESDTDQNTESKSVGDQKDKDVRQRK